MYLLASRHQPHPVVLPSLFVLRLVNRTHHL
nr:MAG TPA: hypothetical protein [Caudoviricetes sp.]